MVIVHELLRPQLRPYALIGSLLERGGFCMSEKIEFLESVDIRKAWSKEDRNFTPWIANPDVTAKLLEQCQIDYDGELTIQTEVTLPGYKRKLDVLVETSSGDRIAIENQFNEIDHDHMTRALAYAVGYSSV